MDMEKETPVELVREEVCKKEREKEQEIERCSERERERRSRRV